MVFSIAGVLSERKVRFVLCRGFCFSYNAWCLLDYICKLLKWVSAPICWHIQQESTVLCSPYLCLWPGCTCHLTERVHGRGSLCSPPPLPLPSLHSPFPILFHVSPFPPLPLCHLPFSSPSLPFLLPSPYSPPFFPPLLPFLLPPSPDLKSWFEWV